MFFFSSAEIIAIFCYQCMANRWAWNWSISNKTHFFLSISLSYLWQNCWRPTVRFSCLLTCDKITLESSKIKMQKTCFLKYKKGDDNSLYRYSRWRPSKKFPSKVKIALPSCDPTASATATCDRSRFVTVIFQTTWYISQKPTFRSL